MVVSAIKLKPWFSKLKYLGREFITIFVVLVPIIMD